MPPQPHNYLEGDESVRDLSSMPGNCEGVTMTEITSDSSGLLLERIHREFGLDELVFIRYVYGHLRKLTEPAPSEVVLMCSEDGWELDTPEAKIRVPAGVVVFCEMDIFPSSGRVVTIFYLPGQEGQQERHKVMAVAYTHEELQGQYNPPESLLGGINNIDSINDALLRATISFLPEGVDLKDAFNLPPEKLQELQKSIISELIMAASGSTENTS